MNIRLGSYVYSQTRYRADDPGLPVGGLVIDLGDTTLYVVNLYRGAVEYFRIATDDAEFGQHGGHINPPVIRDVLRGIASEMARGGDPVRHTTALTVLGGVLARNTPRAS